MEVLLGLLLPILIPLVAVLGFCRSLLIRSRMAPAPCALNMDVAQDLSGGAQLLAFILTLAGTTAALLCTLRGAQQCWPERLGWGAGSLRAGASPVTSAQILHTRHTCTYIHHTRKYEHSLPTPAAQRASVLQRSAELPPPPRPAAWVAAPPAPLTASRCSPAAA